MRRNSQRGFTLIELLIVVAIIGIIAAIAIPNLLNAIDRGRQKRTMADMRSIGTACEEYSIDYNFYPIQTTQGGVTGTFSSVVEPAYIKTTPANDAWNWPIRYGSGAAGIGYTIRSYGKNGVIDASTGQTAAFNCDIAFQDGRFVAWPAGLQT